MTRDLLRGSEGRFYRGNLHCHSDRSDGKASRRRASSAAWGERSVFWVVAAGLSVDFEPPSSHDHAEAITRARDAGAFMTLLHPGLNSLSLGVVDGLPRFGAIDAVEIYNHNTGQAHPGEYPLSRNTQRRVCHASCTLRGFYPSMGAARRDRMTDEADRQPEKSVRGEAAWKQAREAVAARNQRAQKAGREQRDAYERQRHEARRSAEARAHARLLDAKQTR